MVLNILQAIGGVLLLWIFSGILVKYSVIFGYKMGWSTIFVGSVVVGFGTSSPELIISVLSAVRGDLDLAIGNIVGSNSANLSLALGASALITPLAFARKDLESRESFADKIKSSQIFVGISTASVLAFGIFVQGEFMLAEGIALLVLMAAAGWIIPRIFQTEEVSLISESNLIHKPGSQALVPEKESSISAVADSRQSLSFAVFGIILGIAGTVGAAQLFLWGAEGIAESLDVEKGFIGLTLVAIGTSLPEIAVGVRAALKKQTDLLIGNFIGSNIFNSLFVAGAVAVAAPGSVGNSHLTGLAVLAMCVISVVGALFLTTGKHLSRLEGAILLVLWAGFLPFLVGG